MTKAAGCNSQIIYLFFFAKFKVPLINLPYNLIKTRRFTRNRRDKTMPTEPISKDKEKSKVGFILANIAQSTLSSMPAALSMAEILYSLFCIVSPIALGVPGLFVFIASTRLMYLINQPDPMLEARLTGLRKQKEYIKTGSYQPRTLEEIQQMFPALVAEKKDTWFSRARRNNAFALSSTLVGLSTTIAIISLGGTPLPFIAAVAAAAPAVIDRK